jgi:hypothetical protein
LTTAEVEDPRGDRERLADQRAVPWLGLAASIAARYWDAIE